MGNSQRKVQVLPGLDKDVKSKTQVGLLGTRSLLVGSHVALSREVGLALVSQKRGNGVCAPV